MYALMSVKHLQLQHTVIYTLIIDATAGVNMSYFTTPPVLVDEFLCSGSENRLSNCEYTEIGFDSCRNYHQGEATVFCISE